jgi:hypothetical protein
MPVETLNPEDYTTVLSTPEYQDLMHGVTAGLAHHEITYVSFSPDQRTEDTAQLRSAGSEQLPAILAKADAIICISRDEDLNPEYSDREPVRNIVLTPSGRSNVDKSVELFRLAQEQGNTTIRFMATGRMHNRAVRSMLALPVVAEFIGLNAEDLYHVPEVKFKAMLDAAFVPDRMADFKLAVDDETLGANYTALKKVLEDKEYGASVPSVNSTPEELRKVAAAIFTEYQRYPRMSTSRLMVERAVQLGVPLEAIHEEDGAVDTISNLLFSYEAIMAMNENEATPIRNVVIVAGSDHLPRTASIADHILPDDFMITCVEADPNLSAEAYAASCARELASYQRGSEWIAETRDLDELVEIIETGYFSKKREDASETAAKVAGQLSIKHS